MPLSTVTTPKKGIAENRAIPDTAKSAFSISTNQDHTLHPLVIVSDLVSGKLFCS